jgi:hypothetical protein
VSGAWQGEGEERADSISLRFELAAGRFGGGFATSGLTAYPGYVQSKRKKSA